MRSTIDHLTPAPAADNFSLTTVQSDATRAHLQASGRVDSGAAAILAAVIDGHVRAGRRYLRLNVRRVASLDGAALDVLSAVHRRLLDRRGTLVITGVTTAVERVLARADDGLFLLAPTAAERVS